jgi:hypothetical protein
LMRCIGPPRADWASNAVIAIKPAQIFPSAANALPGA